MPPEPKLELRSSPVLQSPTDTPAIMRDVLLALLPVLAAGTAWFGLGALLVVLAATAGSVATEWLFTRPHGSTLHDWSAVLTGVLVGLTLPPAFPLWMAFLGGAVGIGLGKLVWGGLGQNAFNPALVGRAFLQAAFPTAITTWSGLDQPGVHASNLAAPLMQAQVDAVSTATPLGLMKFQHQATELLRLFSGAVPGSIGETSALLIVLAGLWLGWRRAFDWRIPVSLLLAVALASGVVWLLAPDRYPDPLFMLLSGGLLFGAVFMATDPVTSPTSPLGAWIFGAGVGLLVVLIRLWGGLPEGVMYAILLMNAATPLIDRAVQPRPFGWKRGGGAP